jgi:hypothetical protein
LDQARRNRCDCGCCGQEQFYGKLKEQSVPVRVLMEASGHAHWFERNLLEARMIVTPYNQHVRLLSSEPFG